MTLNTLKGFTTKRSIKLLWKINTKYIEIIVDISNLIVYNSIGRRGLPNKNNDDLPIIFHNR